MSLDYMTYKIVHTSGTAHSFRDLFKKKKMKTSSKMIYKNNLFLNCLQEYICMLNNIKRFSVESKSILDF